MKCFVCTKIMYIWVICLEGVQILHLNIIPMFLFFCENKQNKKKYNIWAWKSYEQLANHIDGKKMLLLTVEIISTDSRSHQQMMMGKANTNQQIWWVPSWKTYPRATLWPRKCIFCPISISQIQILEGNGNPENFGIGRGQIIPPWLPSPYLAGLRKKGSKPTA